MLRLVPLLCAAAFVTACSSDGSTSPTGPTPAPIALPEIVDLAALEGQDLEGEPGCRFGAIVRGYPDDETAGFVDFFCGEDDQGSGGVTVVPRDQADTGDATVGCERRPREKPGHEHHCAVSRARLTVSGQGVDEAAARRRLEHAVEQARAAAR